VSTPGTSRVVGRVAPPRLFSPGFHTSRKEIPLSLTELGWNEHVEQHRPEGELVLGRVAVEHRGAYAVYTDGGEAWAELAGKLRYEAAGRGDRPPAADRGRVAPPPARRR